MRRFASSFGGLRVGPRHLQTLPPTPSPTTWVASKRGCADLVEVFRRMDALRLSARFDNAGRTK